MEKYNTFYFAYGANRDLSMINAIIGRKPKGFEYELKGYELCLQKWNEIPKQTRKILKRSWDKNFKSYVIRKSPKKSVWGRIWRMSKEESNLVGEWELHGLWYKPVTLKRKVRGKNLTLKTEIFNDKELTPVKDSKNYPPFPVKKEKILSVANQTRKEYFNAKKA